MRSGGGLRCRSGFDRQVSAIGNGTAIAIAILIVSAGLTAVAHAQPDDPLRRTLQSRFENDRTGVCVLAALIDAQGVTSERYCAKPRPDGGPAFDAAFEIGSISKTMTAFLVSDLIAQKRWSLDDPIARHLPAGIVVPQTGRRQILVKDLLTHSAGLPVLPSRLRQAHPADPYATLTEADLLASLAEVQLPQAPGAQGAYSNFGFMLLSSAVAREVGGDFEAALKARLFEPLGMSGAYVARAPEGVKRAAGHAASGTVVPPWTIEPRLAGMGHVKATLDDMARYAQAMAGITMSPLTPRLQATQKAIAHGFGMSWMLKSVNGKDLVIHEGGTGGFSSLVAMLPGEGRAVVLLADTALTDLGGLSDIGLSLLRLPSKVAAPRQWEPISEALRSAIEGEYDFGPTRVRIRSEAQRLLIQVEGQPAVELFLDSRGDLYPVVVSATLTAVREGERITGFAWRQGGGLIEAVRRGSAKPLTAVDPLWRQWAGEYRITPQFSLRVFEDAGRLRVQGTGQAAITAEVTGTDRVEIRSVGAVLEFKRARDGRVTGLTLRQYGDTLEGSRLATP